MGNSIGISPSVMISRIAYQQLPPQGIHLAEVARLRAELQLAVAENRSAGEPEAKIANGADVDRLI